MRHILDSFTLTELLVLLVLLAGAVMAFAVAAHVFEIDLMDSDRGGEIILAAVPAVATVGVMWLKLR
jgi:hypothetical protein